MQILDLQDAEHYLEGFLNLERSATFDYERLGLARIQALLDGLGHPERDLPCIHIAGSKGKGSVALAAECLLRAAGARVGTYTSPHLETWRERFRIDGEAVAEAELVGALRVLQPHAERLRVDPELRPSFFDVSTALALELFRRAAVDVAVIEVGLGGRLDSTNVIHPRVSVLTSVQLEHTDKLGSTLYEIATEKAGILRKGVPLLHGPLASEALGALMAKAVAVDTPLEEVHADDVEISAEGTSFRLGDRAELFTSILGEHQAHNVALALRAVEHFLARESTVEERASLRRLRVPARIERFGNVVLDCAHTPDSARELRRTLEAIWPGRRWGLGLAVSRDKDARGILRELAPCTRAAWVTRAEPQRAEDPARLAEWARAAGIGFVEACAEPLEALARGRAGLRPGELLVLTGSIYFAGALRSRLA